MSGRRGDSRSRDDFRLPGGAPRRRRAREPDVGRDGARIRNVAESEMNKPTEKGLAGAAPPIPKTVTRKGGDLIAEVLVKEKIPHVFGICGPGHVGPLQPLYPVRGQVKPGSPPPHQTAP